MINSNLFTYIYFPFQNDRPVRIKTMTSLTILDLQRIFHGNSNFNKMFHKFASIVSQKIFPSLHFLNISINFQQDPIKLD